MVETLIGSQANYEIKIKIYLYKIKMYSYKIRITAGLTNIRGVAALSSPKRIAYKLNKNTFSKKN